MKTTPTRHPGAPGTPSSPGGKTGVPAVRSRTAARADDLIGADRGTFGEFLADALARSGLGVREYSRAVMGHDRSHGFVSRVLGGKSLPPLKNLSAWAAPLGLDRTETARFEFLAALAHTPPIVVARLRELEARNASRA